MHNINLRKKGSAQAPNLNLFIGKLWLVIGEFQGMEPSMNSGGHNVNRLMLGFWGPEISNVNLSIDKSARGSLSLTEFVVDGSEAELGASAIDSRLGQLVT